MALSILNGTGQAVEVNPDLKWYSEASAHGLSVEQYVNASFDTDANRFGTPYRQVLAAAGLVLNPNRELGLLSNTIKNAMGDDKVVMGASSINRSADYSSAALRVLFPSAVLTAVEDRLVADASMNADAFDRLVAITDTIVGDKFERPLLNLSRPGAARSKVTAQLAEPQTMLSVTTSEISRKIPELSLGMLISDQAKQATSLDLVSLALARQVATERSTRADEYLLSMLNGDADHRTATLSSLGYSVNASTLDSASTGGVLTHKAWMKFLYRNSKKRVISWVVTDLAGAMSIENRVGKPTVTVDNPNSPRIDSVISVANPTWRQAVNVFITDDPNWPAGTIMGLDNRFAIHRVQSSTIQYQAVEQFVMRRAEGMRFDFGEIAYRLYDEAFDVLVLA